MPYIANKRNVAQLTNAHYWDSAGNAWSGNLIGLATPFALLPNPVLAADLVIFGIDTSVLDSGPFCSLAFDIGSPIAGVTAGQWLYSSAAPATADPNTWIDFLIGPPIVPFQDNTDQGGLMTGVAFDTSGVNSVHWEQPAGWIDTWNPAIGGVALGVTGYWVCWDPTAAAAATPPTQNNRAVYSILWPAVEIAAADVGGDFPALMRMPLRCESSDDVVALPEANRVVAGMRRVDRGADFVSHINFAAEQNPANIAFTGSFIVDAQTPTGYKSDLVLNAAWTEELSIRIYTGLAEQYRGIFRAFMRMDPNAVAGIEGRLDITLFTVSAVIYENLWFSSDVATTRSTNNWEVMDFGRVQLIPDDVLDSDRVNVNIRIMLRRTAGGGATAYLYDLILIPVDEWAGEFDMVPTGSLPWGERQTVGILGTVVDIDSVTVPRRAMNASLRSWLTDDFIYRPRFVGRSPAALTPNEAQRMYFLIMDDDPTYILSKFELSGSTTVETVQRYLSMRGDR